jgi:hypothetical protein
LELDATINIEGLEDHIRRIAREEAEAALAEHAPDGPYDSARAAAYIGVSRRRIHDLVSEARLPRRSEGPGCKLWFWKSDLDAYIKGRRA